MADIVTIIDRNIPPQQRIVYFDGTNAYNIIMGDTLMIKECLGRSAQKVTITGISGVLNIQFNTRQTIVPNASDSQGIFGIKKKLLNQSRETRIETTTITIQSGETLTLDNDILIDDIYIVSRGLIFEILAS